MGFKVGARLAAELVSRGHRRGAPHGRAGLPQAPSCVRNHLGRGEGRPRGDVHATLRLPAEDAAFQLQREAQRQSLAQPPRGSHVELHLCTRSPTSEGVSTDSPRATDKERPSPRGAEHRRDQSERQASY